MKTSLIWRERLQENLKTLNEGHRRVAVLGVGHELRGDDAAGLMVVRRITAASDHVMVVEGGAAPENTTGMLRTFHPHVVILVDAAQLNCPPGTIACLSAADLDGLSASTHTLPLDLLARYLTHELGCIVVLIVIQPAQNNLNSRLSPAVEWAVQSVSTALKELLG